MLREAILIFKQFMEQCHLKKEINLYFAISTGCNLRCNYCYLPDDRLSINEINNEKVKKSIREFLNKAQNEGYNIGSFCFHGAEPALIDPYVLSECANMVYDFWDKKGEHNKAVAIQSNGTKFDIDYLEILKKNIKNPNLIKLGFSIDPPKKVHDKLRCNTFDKVMENFYESITMGFKVSVLSVVGNDTLLYLDEFEKWMKKYLGMKSKFGNPYKVKIKLATGEAALNDKQVIQFADFLIGTDLVSLIQILTPGYCLQAGNECEWYEFDVDGNSYSCNKNFNESGVFASWHEISFDRIVEKRQELFTSYPEHEDCYSCHYQPICNSGCPADRYKKGEMKGKAHECILIRKVLDYILENDMNLAEFYNSN